MRVRQRIVRVHRRQLMLVFLELLRRLSTPSVHGLHNPDNVVWI